MRPDPLHSFVDGTGLSEATMRHWVVDEYMVPGGPMAFKIVR